MVNRVRQWGESLVSSSVVNLRRYGLGAVCLCSTMMAGCEPDQGFSRVVPDSAPGDLDIEFSLDIALQRSAWGESLGRCHLQAALRTLAPRDEKMTPYAESQGTVIAVPEDPMTCTHTVMDSDVPSVEVGGEGDNWAIAGDEVAASEIHLISEERTIVLLATELATGMVRYEWDGCAQASFPFGEVFDLHLPEAEGVYISGFTIESAFAVGPDILINEPTPEGPQVAHVQDQDLVLLWEELHEIPDVRGAPVDVQRAVWARNRAVDESQPFEALGCLPLGHEMTIKGSDWMQLEGNEDALSASHIIGLQVDTVVTSPPFDAPWGKPISIRSTVSDGGDVILVTPRESGADGLW